jgi:uncharacterized membrane protein (DUF2068 family)
MRQFRRELGMRMEHRGWVIWYLIVEKMLQGIFFIGFGIWLLTHRHVVSGQMRGLIDRFDLDEGRNFFALTAYSALHNVAGFSSARLVAIAVGGFFHATLEIVESVGLLLRRRWAEYLVVLATGFLIPVEVYELIRRLTWFRIGVLVFNVAIVLYLIRQKRLFQFESDVPPDRA